jgi:hypothetical protein
MHGCPLHEAVESADADVTATSHGAHHQAPVPDDDGPPPSPCTCVGMCHGSASAPVPAVGAALPPSSTAAFRVALTPGRLLLRARTPCLVPWPNGPPFS